MGLRLKNCGRPGLIFENIYPILPTGHSHPLVLPGHLNNFSFYFQAIAQDFHYESLKEFSFITIYLK